MKLAKCGMLTKTVIRSVSHLLYLCLSVHLTFNRTKSFINDASFGVFSSCSGLSFLNFTKSCLNINTALLWCQITVY